MSDEAALLEKAGTIGEQIFSIEGKSIPSLKNFLSMTFFKNSWFYNHLLVLLMLIKMYTLYEKKFYKSVRKIGKKHEKVFYKR